MVTRGFAGSLLVLIGGVVISTLPASTALMQVALVAELHAIPFGLGIPRVYTVLKLDERRDKEASLASKVASVKALLDP